MFGAASRNRTHIHGVEDRCIIRYTMAANCIGGSGEIRTHGPFRAGSFQDCCNKPDSATLPLLVLTYLNFILMNCTATTRSFVANCLL
jgi:hypothetical protein